MRVLRVILIAVLCCSVLPEAQAADLRCWLAYDGYIPMSEPGGAEVVGKEGQFMQEFRYDPEETVQEGKMVYQKLYTSSGEFGYVDDRYLLTQKTALRVSASKEIFRKVRLSNSYSYVALESKAAKDLGKEVDPQKIVNIPAYSAPLASENRILRNHQLAALRFVFLETEDFVLVGRHFEFSDEKGRTAKDIITGWVQKNRTIEWNTRLAVEWNHLNAGSRKLPSVLFSEYRRYPDGREDLDEVQTENQIVIYAQGRAMFEAELQKLSVDPETLELVAQRRLQQEQLDALKKASSAADATRRSAAAAQLRKIQEQISARDIQQRALIEKLIQGQEDRWKISVSEPILVRDGQLQFQRMLPTDHQHRMPILREHALESPRLAEFSAYRVGGNAGFSGDAAEHEAKQRQLFVISDRLQFLDVQLVIDATSTMRSYITASMAALARIATELQAYKDVSVRLSVSFYRDKTWSAANPESILWFESYDYCDLPLSPLNVAEVRTQLNKVIEALETERRSEQVLQNRTAERFTELLESSPHPFFEMLHNGYKTEASGGGGGRESVFSGVRSAISETKGYRTNGMKLLIVIGDWGDNGDSNDTVERLSQFLSPAGAAPLGLSVIDVSAADERVVSHLGDSFEGVVATLNKRLNADLPTSDPRYTKIARIIRESSPERVSLAIRDQLNDMRQNVENARREIGNIRAEGYDGAGARLTAFAQRVLESGGVRVDELQRIRGAEVFRESLLPYPAAGEIGIRPNILMTRGELDRLVLALEPIAGRRIRDNQVVEGRSLKALMARAVDTLLGQAAQNMTFGEALEALTGLPAKSPLMRLQTDEDWELHENMIKKELERLTMVFFRLQDAQNNRFREYRWIDSKNQEGFPVRELVSEPTNPFGDNPEDSVPRSFRFDVEGLDYYWLDAELEYP